MTEENKQEGKKDEHQPGMRTPKSGRNAFPTLRRPFGLPVDALARTDEASKRVFALKLVTLKKLVFPSLAVTQS